MDPETVIRARQGDEAAFTAIARSTYDRLFGISYRILRDRQLAEDATQQALLRIWRKLPRLQDPARFEAWSYRLLVNVCYSEAKRRSRWRLMPLTSEVRSVRDDIERVGDRDQLERAFRRLSLEQRTVMVLHHDLGMTAPQIAETLGIPVGTVDSRLGRAMAKLRLAIAADNEAVGVSRGRPIP